MSELNLLEAPQYAVHARKRAIYITVTGVLDHRLPSLSSILHGVAPQAGHLIVVDLRQAAAIETGGLAWIERLSARAASMGLRVRLVAPKGTKVRRTLDLMRFNRFLIIAETIRAAVRFSHGAWARA